MSTEAETEFEIVDQADRKSSTSDSFENVEEKDDQHITESSSEDGQEDTIEAPKDGENEKEEVIIEEKLSFVDQSLKDEREKPREKDGEDLVQEALNAPIRPDQEQFYRDEDSRKAITLLILFSAMMFTLPLLVMFSLYYWVFIDHFHLPPHQAMLYSGICAAVVVVILCATFAYLAYKEEKEAEETLKKQK